jgi:GntR family transcriptional repressor for pyruvate dehydrogenase complex
LTSPRFGLTVCRVFTSVRTPRVYEHIVEQIEQAIVDGRLRRGDRLPPERELVRQFGASRVVVREALRTLEHRGLVDVRHGASGGHFVRDVDGGLLRRDFATLLRLARVSVEQLTEARLILEPEVAALAAERATPDDLAALHDTLVQRAAALAAGESPRALDTGFHRLVAATAKNPVHTVLTDALMGIEADVVLPHVALSDEDHDEIAGAHRAIVDAIALRRPDDARVAMAAHIDDLRHRLRPQEAAAGRP